MFWLNSSAYWARTGPKRELKRTWMQTKQCADILPSTMCLASASTYAQLSTPAARSAEIRLCLCLQGQDMCRDRYMVTLHYCPQKGTKTFFTLIWTLTAEAARSTLIYHLCSSQWSMFGCGLCGANAVPIKQTGPAYFWRGPAVIPESKEKPSGLLHTAAWKQLTNHPIHCSYMAFISHDPYMVFKQTSWGESFFLGLLLAS